MTSDEIALVSPSLMSEIAPLASVDAQMIAERFFGVSGTAVPLNGERDENFLIHTSAGAFVLKVTNAAENRRVTAFQTRVLIHVARTDPLLPVPRLMLARDGGYDAECTCKDGRPRIVRLMSLLPGIVAASAPATPALRKEIGGALARLDTALAGLADSESDQDLSWDLKHALRLRHLVAHVESEADRFRTERALDEFERFVVPEMSRLRSQVIHNDLNLFNILVDENSSSRITGIIDFGDLVHAPLINDLAIAASYHFTPLEAPLAPILEIVSAYNAIVPLRATEADLLYDLISTRLAMTVLITGWRARRYPENRGCILKNYPGAILGLARLSEIDRRNGQEQFRRACGLEI